MTNVTDGIIGCGPVAKEDNVASLKFSVLAPRKNVAIDND
jgi:hypothetical protein